ncbi:MAG TPA: hypothetical protein VGO58_00765 [Chitinophagaceae bacterium]|nr:hypothetical protein [Chitinophagaceae bacterium]
MTKVIAGFVLLASCSCTAPQKEDAAIRNRLDEFFHCYKAMDMEKMIDYYHPVIFEHTTRESVLDDMKKNLAGRSPLFKIDSFHVDSLYPVFRVEDGRYAKVSYSINVWVDAGEPEDSVAPKKITGPVTDHVISTDMYPAPQATLRRTLIWGNEPGMKKIGVDPATGWTKFHVNRQLLAIKDPHAKKWSFISLDEGASPDNLLDKKVRNKLALYN